MFFTNTLEYPFSVYRQFIVAAISQFTPSADGSLASITLTTGTLPATPRTLCKWSTVGYLTNRPATANRLPLATILRERHRNLTNPQLTRSMRTVSKALVEEVKEDPPLERPDHGLSTDDMQDDEEYAAAREEAVKLVSARRKAKLAESKGKEVPSSPMRKPTVQVQVPSQKASGL